MTQNPFCLYETLALHIDQIEVLALWNLLPTWWTMTDSWMHYIPVLYPLPQTRDFNQMRVGRDLDAEVAE